MEITILLEYSERSQLSAWLQGNHSKEKECCIDLEGRGLMTQAGRDALNNALL